jgi:formate dehydrogenase subunit delta
MDVERLIYMANQIARNLAAQGEDEAVAATADHIDKFWDPRMKAQLFEHEGEGLDPIAARAVSALREGQASQAT